MKKQQPKALVSPSYSCWQIEFNINPKKCSKTNRNHSGRKYQSVIDVSEPHYKMKTEMINTGIRTQGNIQTHNNSILTFQDQGSQPLKLNEFQNISHINKNCYSNKNSKNNRNSMRKNQSYWVNDEQKNKKDISASDRNVNLSNEIQIDKQLASSIMNQTHKSIGKPRSSSMQNCIRYPSFIPKHHKQKNIQSLRYNSNLQNNSKNEIKWIGSRPVDNQDMSNKSYKYFPVRKKKSGVQILVNMLVKHAHNQEREKNILKQREQEQLQFKQRQLLRLKQSFYPNYQHFQQEPQWNYRIRQQYKQRRKIAKRNNKK